METEETLPAATLVHFALCFRVMVCAFIPSVFRHFQVLGSAVLPNRILFFSLLYVPGTYVPGTWYLVSFFVCRILLQQEGSSTSSTSLGDNNTHSAYGYVRRQCHTVWAGGIWALCLQQQHHQKGLQRGSRYCCSWHSCCYVLLNYSYCRSVSALTCKSTATRAREASGSSNLDQVLRFRNCSLNRTMCHR